MNLDAFTQDRESDWSTLDELLRRSRGRPERLGPSGVLELGALYRAASADLAFVRRRAPDDALVQRLEALVLRARSGVYGLSERRRSPLRFFTHDYWQLVRARPTLLAFAALAQFGPMLACAIWAIHNPGAAVGLLPTEYRGAASPHVHAIPSGAVTQATLASSIFTNNIQVTFLVFAGGLLFGVGTLWVLAYNGILVGTLAGLTIQNGQFSVFVRYVVPHGVLELSCITIAGMAGLRLATALIEPGEDRRIVALRREARPAVMLVLGTALWLVLAGCIEGFVTPRGLALRSALTLGVVVGGAFWTLVLVRARPVTAAPAPSP